MKTKFVISFLSALLISSSAFADSAKMEIGIFEGQVFTKENVQIQSIKFEAGFNFCWGFCSSGLSTKLKQIKIQTASSSNKKAVNYRSSEAVSVRGGSILGRFSYCGVQITVSGIEANGQAFSATSLVSTSDAKGDCARGGATPYSPNSLELRSYPSNGGYNVYYVAE